MKFKSDNDAATKKGMREPKELTKPPNTGPIIKPRPNAAPTKPKFCALFSGKLTSDIKAFAVVKLAPHIPAIILPIKSQVMLGAKHNKM